MTFCVYKGHKRHELHFGCVIISFHIVFVGSTEFFKTSCIVLPSHRGYNLILLIIYGLKKQPNSPYSVKLWLFSRSYFTKLDNKAVFNSDHDRLLFRIWTRNSTLTCCRNN